MTETHEPGGPLDIATLRVVGRRATSHPLVDQWALQPDDLSPRRLTVQLDPGQYPASVVRARVDIRWYTDGCYTFHYVEERDSTDWQCRWDRHPKPDAPTAHLHPSPDAAADVRPSPIEATHHLGVLFAVLDWVDDRVASLHAE